jgi:hypothetical protein
MMKEACRRKRGDERALPGESEWGVGHWRPATVTVSSAVPTDATGDSRALALTVARARMPESEVFTSAAQQVGLERVSPAEAEEGRQQQEPLAPSPPLPQGMAQTAPKAGASARTITVKAASPFFKYFLVIFLSINFFPDFSTFFFPCPSTCCTTLSVGCFTRLPDSQPRIDLLPGSAIILDSKEKNVFLNLGDRP